MSTPFRIDDRERATILAALRHLQESIITLSRSPSPSTDPSTPDAKDLCGGRYASLFIEHDPLNLFQIDELCERLNS